MVKQSHKIILEGSLNSELEIEYYPQTNQWYVSIESTDGGYEYVELPYEKVLELKKFLEELA